MTERRFSDTKIGRVVALWPLVVALVSVIVMATTIKNKVEDHESRLTRLEDSMGMIRSNTDRLVIELLGK